MESSECRKRVAKKWGKIDYRTSKVLSTDDDSTSTTDIDSDDSVREVKKVKHEIIDLTTCESDDADGEDVVDDSKHHHARSARVSHSPFKLMKSEVYDQNIESAHFITLKQIFGNKTLRKCFLFSFQYQLDFLLEQFHQNVRAITIVAQSGTINTCTTETAMSFVDRLSIIEFTMPPYTCHHSKMIINFYEDDSCKIFLPSNNFTYAETNYPQQVCWTSPQLKCSDSTLATTSSPFQTDLIDYMQSYGIGKIEKFMIPALEKLDFSPLEGVNFIYSTPSKGYTSGFQLLAHKLLTTLPKKSSTAPENKTNHYLCQTSTIGASISKKTPANLFTHVFIPILEKIMPCNSKLMGTDILLKEFKSHNIIPYLIYPTVEEIRTSPTGFLCSGWFHFNYLRDRPHYDMLLNQFSIFYKQDPRLLSQERRATPSHSKFYMKSSTNGENSSGSSAFDNLDWCVYTSSNLSYSAWGKAVARPRNYEVGILLTSAKNRLRCRSFLDVIYYKDNMGKLEEHDSMEDDHNMTIMVPFTLPVAKYKIDLGDEAFCMAKDYQLIDVNGMPYDNHA